MRGRKPKPVAQKLAEGDTWKVGVGKLQEQIAAEPKAARGLPPCPEHVTDPVARDQWDFWAEELAAMDLDRRPDGAMLEGAVVNYAAAVKAGIEVARFGEVIQEPIFSEERDPETKKFKVIGIKQRKNVWVQIRERSWMLVHRFCSEFGLSPVARTRLTIDKKDTAMDDLLAALSKPRAPKAKPEPVN